MPTSQKERLSFLAQRDKATRETPIFIEHLQAATGMPSLQDSLLSFEATQELMPKLQLLTGQAFSRTSADRFVYGPASSGEFDYQRDVFLFAFGLEPVLLWLGRFSHLPLVRLSAVVVARSFYKLWKLGDTVIACTADASRGVAMDWHPDDLDETFEIATWGMN
jgi:hypothetical protein